jgi:hypothetical protein
VATCHFSHFHFHFLVCREWAKNSISISIIKWGRESSDLHGSVVLLFFFNKKIYFVPLCVWGGSRCYSCLGDLIFQLIFPSPVLACAQIVLPTFWIWTGGLFHVSRSSLSCLNFPVDFLVRFSLSCSAQILQRALLGFVYCSWFSLGVMWPVFISRFGSLTT